MTLSFMTFFTVFPYSSKHMTKMVPAPSQNRIDHTRCDHCTNRTHDLERTDEFKDNFQEREMEISQLVTKLDSVSYLTDLNDFSSREGESVEVQLLESMCGIQLLEFVHT